ncbi:hypothetical protein RDI58_000976 [Solanum bulbocastanum]|uniref:Uncharacterized protein n=1 Tax=Solanum bulbocastanum TaxID=147425 RepID=A0AAN8YSV2_SOLBU
MFVIEINLKAEGYIVEESIIFCSRYLPGNVKGYDRMDKNYEDDHIKTYSGLSIFEREGSPLLRDASRNLEEFERKQAHLYVLRNCEVQPFLQLPHLAYILIKAIATISMTRVINACNFDDWFFHWEYCTNAQRKNQLATCELYSLARGPFDGVQRFKGYEINGFRFHTKLLEEMRKTQNSGVLVRGEANGKNINYYGVLTEIIELQYFEGPSSSQLVKLNGHSTYFTGGAIDEDTLQQDACNELLHICEDDEDIMNWERNDLDVIRTVVTLADDIIEVGESEPETDDEDLLLYIF